jgi:hypothetical protein
MALPRRDTYIRHSGDKHEDQFPHRTGDFSIDIKFDKDGIAGKYESLLYLFIKTGGNKKLNIILGF